MHKRWIQAHLEMMVLHIRFCIDGKMCSFHLLRPAQTNFNLPVTHTELDITLFSTSHNSLFSSHFNPHLLLFSGSSRQLPQQYFTSWFILVLESCDPKYCNWPWAYRSPPPCWLVLQLPASAYETLHNLSLSTSSRPSVWGEESYTPYLYAYVCLRGL